MEYAFVLLCFILLRLQLTIYLFKLPLPSPSSEPAVRGLLLLHQEFPNENTHTTSQHSFSKHFIGPTSQFVSAF